MDDNLQNLSKKERRGVKRQHKKFEAEKFKRSRLLKRFAFWLSAMLIVAGAVFGMINLVSRSSAGDSSKAAIVDVLKEGDWIKGNEEAEIELIEYSDFQCPACASYYPLVKRLAIDFGADIKFVYRHFPLNQHKNAELAARAAEAAGRQGGFWEMHDKIFEGQKNWSDKSESEAKNIFTNYAASLDLDIDKLVDDLDEKDVKEKVSGDYQSGIRAGVNATPTFFLNGKKIQNPRNYEEFKSVIQGAILQNS